MLEKITSHYENKTYAEFTRAVGKGTTKTNSGYVVNFSKDFVLLQESDDFKIAGLVIFPVSQIKKIRYNNWDKYYNKIMIWEGEAANVGTDYNIDLSDWESILNSINFYNLNVIVECENPQIDTFRIGPIVEVTKKLVYIIDFDPTGFLDEGPTAIDFESITIVQFDDRYSKTLSKYLRRRKQKNKMHAV